VGVLLHLSGDLVHVVLKLEIGGPCLDFSTKGQRAYIYIQVSQEERAKLREGVPYVKLYRYNPKHLIQS